MKRKPIKKPNGRFEGLSIVYPPLILDKDTIIYFPDTFISLDDKVWIPDKDKSMKLDEFEEKFKEHLDVAKCVEIQFESAFHDETYEYNKYNGKWYLVDQGKGYA